MIERFKDAFREEAAELIAGLEDDLLRLEKAPEDVETIGAVFRAMHTLKGSSSMFGFDAIAAFTHELESVMVMLREGLFRVDRRFIDMTLKARDLISAMLNGDSSELRDEASALASEYRLYAEKRGAALADEKRRQAEALGADTLASSAEADPTLDVSDKVPQALGLKRFLIHFEPASDIFLNGTRPLLLLDELRRLGEATIKPLARTVPKLEELDPEKCYMAWDIDLVTEKGKDAIRDIFIFVEGACSLNIEELALRDDDDDREETLPDLPEVKRLGEILVERGVTTKERVAAVLSEKRRLGEVLVEQSVATPEQIQSALDEQARQRNAREQNRQELNGSSLRVASEKLDSLVDLVGELVTTQARLSQTAVLLGDSALSAVAEQFERLVSQLRDNALSIRMLPIGTAFSRFRRVVRDLSAELGKLIELETEGGETELDKTVIERLTDPLVHLIRNSVDHGIEMPDERKMKGKGESGTVRLSACHSGANVIIEIQDDGAGLDYDKIVAKAVERGLMPQGASLSEQEAYQLIFSPGFSTAAKVSSVSGRGVGMDVVKREIEALGGAVSLNSERGKGTRVSLKLPLTLAIIEGLLVRVDQAFYVLPLSAVDGCVEYIRTEGDRKRQVMTYRAEIVPFAALRSLFRLQGSPPPVEQIVVVNAAEERLGLVVDEVVGDYQTVIKPLGRLFKKAEGIAGATILGDGKVALILDVNKAAEAARRDEAVSLALNEAADR